MLVLLFTILTGSLLAQTAELPAYLDPRLSRQLFEEEFPTLLQSRTLKLKNPVNVFVHDKWLYAAGKRIQFGQGAHFSCKRFFSLQCPHQCVGFMSNQVFSPLD